MEHLDDAGLIGIGLLFVSFQARLRQMQRRTITD
jgi:hypothetical protein